MLSWFRQLDDLLRGRKTAPESLTEGRLELALRAFVPLAVGLGAVYGLFMGLYAVLSCDPARYEQLLASTVKLPALFLLTLVVTFPSLYVFNALVGCRLTFTATLRLLVGAVTVNVAVAASLGPILGFFTLSTTSYPFMILLNVALLAVAGAVALAFLLHTLRRLAGPTWTILTPTGQAAPDSPPLAVPVDDSGTGPSNATGPPQRGLGPLDPVAPDVPAEALGQARSIFRIWVILYGLVGAQMGWLLRPFVGSPHQPFEWFRHREGNFFLAVGEILGSLVSGK